MRLLLKTGFAALCAVLLVSATHAQTMVQVDQFPQNLQLYQRDTDNLAQVTVTGNAPAPYNQVSLKILRGTALYFYQKQSVNTTTTAPYSFSFNPGIRAEAVEYDFSLYTHTSPTDSILVRHSARIVCGDLLVLYGQSNVLALNDIDGYVVDDRLLRNFTYPFQSTDIPDQVSWSTAKQPYGTVGGIGIWLQKLILEKYSIPTAVINGGVGGTAISTLSIRDPGDHASLNTEYGLLLYRVKRAGLADKARIIVYKQGEADAAYNTDHYDDALRTLTNQFEEDYPAVKKIYVSQLNILSDPEPRGGEVRDAQRRARQQAPLIESIATVGTPTYDGVHYLRVGNQQIATELFRQIARDFYGEKDTLQINSPDIKTATFNASRDTITLTFEDQMRMVWPKDTTYYDYAHGTQYTRRMIDFIYLDGQAGAITSGVARRNQVILALNGPSTAQTITYLPAYFSDANSPFYDGVHLKNERGMRAFSFDKFPIQRSGAPKSAQAISFTTINATTYSDAPITLTATASSKLPVTFQVVSGPGVVLNSHQLRLTGSGLLTVKARQPGDDYYQPALEVVLSISVSKESQSISNLGQTIRLGQQTLVLSATASSGLPIRYTLLTGPASLSVNRLTLSDFGQATLQLSQPGDDRYLPAADVIQTICLNPQKPTISLDSASGLVLVSSSPFRNQWFMDGDSLRNETGQRLTVSQEGSYVVKVRNPVAVCNDVEPSAPRVVVILATEPQPLAARLSVYPNPATDQVRIRLKSTSLTPPGLQLTDGSGRVLHEPLVLKPVAEGYETTFSVRSLKSGVYLLRATTETGPITSRLLIRP